MYLLTINVNAAAEATATAILLFIINICNFAIIGFNAITIYNGLITLIAAEFRE